MIRSARVPRRLTVTLAALLLGACAPDGSDSGRAANTAGGNTAVDPTGTWTIETIGDRPVVDESPASMTFAADGTVAGNGSCNRFTGGYEINGEQISMGPLAATSRACADEAISEQETRLFKAFGNVARIRIEDGMLVLSDANGGPLVRASRAD